MQGHVPWQWLLGPGFVGRPCPGSLPRSIVPLSLIRQELPLGYRRSLTLSLGCETELLQPWSFLMITLVRPHHEVFLKIHCGGWMGLATPHIPF